MFKNKILFKAYVGGDYNHPIFNTLFKTKFRFFSLPYIGAMAIAPLRLFAISKNKRF
jgi:hypothetical protein